MKYKIIENELKKLKFLINIKNIIQDVGGGGGYSSQLPKILSIF